VRFFDCAWLSIYPGEDEKFFLHGTLIIKNIKTATTAQNFVIYVETLNAIQQMFKGIYYTESTNIPLEMRKSRLFKKSKKDEHSGSRIHPMIRKTVIRMLEHELNRHDPSKFRKLNNIPEYIEETLHFYCGEMKELSMDWRTIHDKTRGYVFARKLLLDGDFNMRWLDMNVLQMLFPNMEKLIVEDVYLCDTTWEALLNFCRSTVEKKEEEEEYKRDDHQEQSEDVTMDSIATSDGDERDEDGQTKAVGDALQTIVIYRPSKVDYGDTDVDHSDDKDHGVPENQLDKVLKDYSARYQEYGWEMSKKARFEMLIKRM